MRGCLQVLLLPLSTACADMVHVVVWYVNAGFHLPVHAEPVQPPAQLPDKSNRSARPAARQRRKPNRGLTITIPQEQSYDSMDSRSSSGQGPVYIRVHKVTVPTTRRPFPKL